MQNSKINRVVAVAGFAVLAIGLGLEGVALYETYADAAGAYPNERPSLERPAPMIRFLFDRTS